MGRLPTDGRGHHPESQNLEKDEDRDVNEV